MKLSENLNEAKWNLNEAKENLNANLKTWKDACDTFTCTWYWEEYSIPYDITTSYSYKVYTNEGVLVLDCIQNK